MRTPLSSVAIALISLFCISAPAPAAAAEDGKELQARIDDASAGAVVTIAKGVWTEPLTIDKPLTLRGADRDGCVIEVVSDEPAIRLKHAKGAVALENLTVRWKLATSERPQGPQAAIVLKDGTLRMSNVRVQALDNFARCPSAFTAYGFGDATIEKCDFDGYEFTIQFGGGAKGSLSDCLVADPGHCGITAGPESVVNVERTIVTGSRYHGVRCTGGELNIAHSVIIANKNRGIYLGNKSARGTIHDNVIQESATGISAFAESEVKIENNFIAGSDFAAVDMRDSCRLTVENNLLSTNARGLVLFAESGENHNTIGRNGSAGNKIETEGFADPPELVVLQGQPPEGAFAVEESGDFGLSSPTGIKPVWQRWIGMRKSGAAE